MWKFSFHSDTPTMSEGLLGIKNDENKLFFAHVFVILEVETIERWKTHLSKSSFILLLWFIRRLLTPEFQLAECQFFILFFAHTDTGNIIRREIGFLLHSPCCFDYLPRARAIKSRFSATLVFFWKRLYWRTTRNVSIRKRCCSKWKLTKRK